MHQTAHGLALDHPTELAEFTHHGVHFERASGAWERAIYTATDRFGNPWTVERIDRKRYSWRIHGPRDGDVFRARTLPLAALWISRYARAAKEARR